MEEGLKYCKKCGEEKSVDDFYKNSRSKDGYSRLCKKCIKICNQSFNFKVSVEEKQCLKCNKLKLSSEFNKNKVRKDGLCVWCKECNKDHSCEYRQTEGGRSAYKRSIRRYNQTERGKESHKKYLKNYNQSEQGRKTQRKHDKKRIESGKCAEYERNRRKTNINFKIKSYLRIRINSVLKNQKIIKSQHTLDLLGCSLEHLKQHLESQFQSGMTWENRGKWHLDHIIPCSYFDLSIEENQFICFNYRNLQPLWAKDNLQKSNRVSINTEEFIDNIKIHLKTQYNDW